MGLSYRPTKAALAPPPSFQDPLALIFGLVIVAPFLILGIAIATGVLDISVYKGR